MFHFRNWPLITDLLLFNYMPGFISPDCPIFCILILRTYHFRIWRNHYMTNHYMTRNREQGERGTRLLLMTKPKYLWELRKYTLVGHKSEGLECLLHAIGPTNIGWHGYHSNGTTVEHVARECVDVCCWVVGLLTSVYKSGAHQALRRTAPMGLRRSLCTLGLLKIYCYGN